MRNFLLTTTIIISCFLFGAGSMYLIDSTWVYDKVDRHKEKMNNNLTRYTEAIDVSQRMTTNCYDAFYLISECSKEDGCNFETTVEGLTELNLERKLLRLRLDQLLTPTHPIFHHPEPNKMRLQSAAYFSKPTSEYETE